jgi:hypothetical protein
MLGLSRRENAAAAVAEIDDVLASLVASLDRCSDPFDRLRIFESIDAQLDRRLTAMADCGEPASSKLAS